MLSIWLPWCPGSTSRGSRARLRRSMITTCGWSPRRGEFTRHSHPETDEFFLVLAGSLTIRFDDDEVTLGPGQLHVVPRGVYHQPISSAGAQVLLLEPSATVNTGDTPSPLMARRRLA